MMSRGSGDVKAKTGRQIQLRIEQFRGFPATNHDRAIGKISFESFHPRDMDGMAMCEQNGDRRETVFEQSDENTVNIEAWIHNQAAAIGILGDDEAIFGKKSRNNNSQI